MTPKIAFKFLPTHLPGSAGMVVAKLPTSPKLLYHDLVALQAICDQGGQELKFPLVVKQDSPMLCWEPRPGVIMPSDIPASYYKAVMKRPAAKMPAAGRRLKKRMKRRKKRMKGQRRRQERMNKTRMTKMKKKMKKKPKMKKMMKKIKRKRTQMKRLKRNSKRRR